MGIHLLLEEPFFGHLLASLPKASSAAVPDVGLAVSGQEVVLLVNETWAARSGESALSAVKHELLHLLLRHPFQAIRAREFRLFSLAAELAVNRLMTAHERPAGALTPEAWNLPPDTWSAYEVLQTDWRRVLRNGEEAPAWWMRLSALEARPDSPLSRHRYWLAGSTRVSEASRRVLGVQMEQYVRQAAHRAAGQLPPGLAQWIDPPSAKEPRVDWRRQLRLFATRSRRTRLRDTLRRPSRRYGLAPGLRLLRGARLLVAIDTSASVEPPLLQIFLTEIHHLWWRQGAEVTVVECDTAIRRRYEYRGQWPAFVTGRGGTLFEAPIAWANEQFRPDALVYFTDGKGPPPHLNCHCPLLWVIAGEEGRHLPGQIVRIGVEG